MSLTDSTRQTAEARIEEARQRGATMLDLSKLGLTELPATIGQLTALQRLFLNDNQLSELPAEIGHLTALVFLMLDRNRLITLPDTIGRLEGLHSLHVSENRLLALPESLRQLPQLRRLFLHENHGLDIPPEVLGPTWEELQARSDLTAAQPEQILRFFSARRVQPTRPLGEAKILVVGQASVGKSSLVRQLRFESFEQRSPTTEGISITKSFLAKEAKGWTMVEPRKTPPASVDIVRVNIWDFGGQDIMHTTHRFFLTQRSLYLLVLDARQNENDANLDYWLNLIRSYGGDAPTIVVVNKCEPPFRMDLNENRWMKDFAPNLVAFMAVSCASGMNIPELRALIAGRVAGLPHIATQVPVSYFAVKEQLESSTDDFLDYVQYEQLCRQGGLTDPSDRQLLLRFLHDVGSVLNYSDPNSPYRLSNTNVLKPEWVTRGVYDVLLKSRRYMQQDGVLPRTCLSEILDTSRYPVDRHDFIIGMMVAFDLCYEFPGQPARLLIPEQLGRNEPELSWPTAEALNFQYHYERLPEGIILRFIVKMGRYFTKHPTCWRSGVVVQFDECKALIRADSQKKRIYVSVQGPVAARRTALAVIRATFGEIHATIPRFNPEAMVAIPGQPELAVGYEHLLQLEKIGQTTLLPQGGTQLVNVSELLHGITPEEFMRSREPLPPAPPPPDAQGTAAEHEQQLYRVQLFAAPVLGTLFLLLMLLVAVAIPQPSDFQIWVFRGAFAVTAAAFGAVVPGLISLNISAGGLFALRAGGALVLFAFIYLINPPKLVKNDAPRRPYSAAPR